MPVDEATERSSAGLRGGYSASSFGQERASENDADDQPVRAAGGKQSADRLNVHFPAGADAENVGPYLAEPHREELGYPVLLDRVRRRRRMNQHGRCGWPADFKAPAGYFVWV